MDGGQNSQAAVERPVLRSFNDQSIDVELDRPSVAAFSEVGTPGAAVVVSSHSIYFWCDDHMAPQLRQLLAGTARLQAVTWERYQLLLE
jgi:hypothetical protein